VGGVLEVLVSLVGDRPAWHEADGAASVTTVGPEPYVDACLPHSRANPLAAGAPLLEPADGLWASGGDERRARLGRTQGRAGLHHSTTESRYSAKTRGGGARDDTGRSLS
jgi:hypothetical protein